MKTDYKKDSRRIQKIIAMIQNRLYLSPEEDVVHYQELLTLSENTRNKYGQALAHINLAQYYQIINNLDLYDYHIRHAKNIADKNGYLDVTIDYYNLKGFEYLNSNDDVTALSS